MKRLAAIGLLPVLMGFTAAANAGFIQATQIFGSPQIIDDSSTTTLLNVVGSGNVTDVNVWIDFTKCDEAIDDADTCNGSDFSWNDEISFSLSHGATTAKLVVDYLSGTSTYQGSTPGQRARVLFDDGAAAKPNGAAPMDGTFKPEELLSAFNTQAAAGTWTLTYGDADAGDPLGLNGWRLDITTDFTGPPPQGTPAPATLLLLGLGLATMGGLKRRKFAS
jgi:hypothetical protein